MVEASKHCERFALGGDALEQQKKLQTDRLETAMRMFDSMSDDGQVNAMLALEALSHVFPRRALVSLRLVSGSSGKARDDSQ